MKFCHNCGAQLPDGTKFCTSCGTKQELQPVPAPVAEPAPAPVYTAPVEEPAPAPVYAAPVEEPVVELAEEEVPLAMLPATGDMAGLWMAMSGISMAGMFLLKKRSEEE